MLADYLNLAQAQAQAQAGAVHCLLSLDHSADGRGLRDFMLGAGLLNEYEMGRVGRRRSCRTGPAARHHQAQPPQRAGRRYQQRANPPSRVGPESQGLVTGQEGKCLWLVQGSMAAGRWPLVIHWASAEPVAGPIRMPVR